MRIACLMPLLFAGCAVTTAGFAATDASGGTADRTITYRCADGLQFIVFYSGASARLTDPQGRSYTLKRRSSGSGTLYQGAGQRLQGKGDEVTWTAAGGTAKTCPANTALPGFRIAKEDIVHEATGMVFPARVGNAVREASRPGDVEGELALVRYRVPIPEGGEARVAIGLVHLEGMTAAQHYAAFRGPIMRRIADATVRHEGPFQIVGASDARYGLFAGKDQASGLITADFGYWSARLITAYPVAQLDAAQMAITNFVQKIDWSPLRGNQTGTQAGAAAQPPG